ncbi:MAG TPA: TIGR03118 family protein [Rhizomicrobium sp.]
MRREISLAFGLLLLASPAFAQSFKAVPLVSNQTAKAPNVDPNLVNPWGLAQAPGGPYWVSDNGTGLSTLYSQGTGKINSLVVTVPDGSPTGIVYVPSGAGFSITENGKSGNSVFIFDSEAGVISGWSPSVDATNAVVAYNGSSKGSVYKGLAVDPASKLLFAADFFNNQVQIFDNTFALVGSFTDTTLPRHYAPFNVAIISGDVYVTFAKQDKSKLNEIDGPGLGYLDVFSESGQLLKQLVAAGPLDAPWGMAIAPSDYGSFANSLLVGNFGNNWINAFDPTSGALLGTLSTKSGNPLTINNVWALDNTGTGISFSAGPHNEKNGLLGVIKVDK